MRERLELEPNVWFDWRRQRKSRTEGSTISIHRIIIMIKHQRLRMRQSHREADRGRHLAKVAVIERSQIEYHPACQDRCEELLKPMFFSSSKEKDILLVEEVHLHG